MQEVGGLIGRFLIAMVLAAGAFRWGTTLRMFQVPGLILTALLFWFFLRAPNQTFFEIPLEAVYLGTVPVTTMSIGIFLVGLCTVAQLSFWGNYLPHVYPVHLRGTGESFAANIGGRMIGTSAALLTAQLANGMPLAYAAASVALLVYVVGFACSFWLPEPTAENLPE